MKWATAGLAIAGAGASLLCAASASAQVSLGAAEPFAVLAGSSVSNTGATVVTGSVGVFPGFAVFGFPPGVVVGGTLHPGDATATQAQNDLTTAYNTAAGLPCGVGNALSSNLDGLTLTPGVYCFVAGAGLTGTLTLDFEGDPNAEFVFQVPTTLITATGSTVALTDNAGATCGPNVLWQVGSSAILGTNSTFKGDILALTSTTLTTGVTLHGRALPRNGTASLDTNVITRCDPIASADLSVSATSTPASVAPGADVTYNIVATNQGPDAAASTTMTATVPSGLAFKSLVVPAGWSCATPAVGASGTVSCSIASFAVGSSGFTLAATLSPGTSSVPAVQVGVDSPTMDLEPSNDSAAAADSQVAVPTPPPTPVVTPTPTPTSTPTPPACTSRRSFTVQLKTLRRNLRTARVVSAKLLTDRGKTLRKLRVTRSRITVDLRGLSKQRLVVQATVRTRAGKTVRVRRNYGTCAKPDTR